MSFKYYLQKTLEITRGIMMVILSIIFNAIVIGAVIVAPIYHFVLRG